MSANKINSYNTDSKKASPLLILLFLAIIAASVLIPKIYSPKDYIQETENPQKEEINKSIEAIEIYRLNPYKEASIVDHWYFRDPESIEAIKSIFKKENEKTTSIPPDKAEYKIILSYDNKDIAVCPLWLEEGSNNAIIENEEYQLVSKSGTKKLRELIEAP